MKNWINYMFAAACAVAAVTPAQAAPGLEEITRQLAAASAHAGVSIAEVKSDGTSHVYSVGTVAPGEPLRGNSGFRMASITKTYTAATVLRLWEDGRIKLDESIRTYVDPAYIALMEKDGYDTAKITVRHLLTHTSGMADHAQTKAFLDTITNKPDTAWTRDSHMKAFADWTDPVGKPGEKYSYSDSGYILLGHIVEKLTSMPLPKTVRSHLGLDRLNLPHTYWELAETPGAKAGARVHQFMDGHDTYNWNATLDHYGGGGLVASPEDMARFMLALFEGKVFRKPGTLDEMLSKKGVPDGSPYRLGIFEYDMNGVQAYGHAGFWGTIAMYVPSQKRALAYGVTRKETYKQVHDALKSHIASQEQRATH